MSNPEPRPAESISPLRAIGRALANRNYRLFFFGQGVSLIGTWMSRVATSWLVYRLSDPGTAAYLLGVIGFLSQVPAFFVTPLAGVLVDRWNRHRLIVVTQILSLVQSVLLAWVAFSSLPSDQALWIVGVLNFGQGLINALDMPARQSFLVEMIARKEDLGNAIALNSSLVNGARLVGPAIAGAIITAVGEGWCFVIDAVSYVAVVVALLAMTLTPRPQPPERKPLWRGLAEGFRYSFGFAPIRTLLLQVALVSFMGMPFTVLLPIFAGEILGGGPSTLGMLLGAVGLGALGGAFFLASRPTVRGLGRTIVVATALFGTGLVGFSLSPWLWLSIPLLSITGFGMMVQMAASNTIIQTIVEEDKRGRVMGFFTTAFLGTMPFGSLFAGLMAGWVGAPTTVLIGGIICCLAAIHFAIRLPMLRTLIRPIYVQLGIVKDVV